MLFQTPKTLLFGAIRLSVVNVTLFQLRQTVLRNFTKARERCKFRNLLCTEDGQPALLGRARLVEDTLLWFEDGLQLPA